MNLLLVFFLAFVNVSYIFACSSSSRPRPPRFKCADFVDSSFSSSPGLAPLYNGNSDASEYIIVLKDEENIEQGTEQITGIVSKTINRQGPPQIKTLNGSSGGLKAVITNLTEEELIQVRRKNCVKYIEKNRHVYTTGYTSVWGLDRIDQHYLPLDYNYSPSGYGFGQYVYVVDSGINSDHVKFSGRAENWYEAVTGSTPDCTGHGTHVAGTIAATTYGVATGVRIRSVRAFQCGDTSPTSIVIEALNHINENGNGGVVSMSLSGSGSRALDDAVERLLNNGYAVVAAAGNYDVEACSSSPGRVNGVITVGATDSSDTRASFSNHGPGVDVFAPGVNIRSLSHTSNTGTSYKDGTSMAVPHVSGFAAILRSRGESASNIRQKIIDLSTKNVVQDRKGSNDRLLYVD